MYPLDKEAKSIDNITQNGNQLSKYVSFLRLVITGKFPALSHLSPMRCACDAVVSPSKLLGIATASQAHLMGKNTFYLYNLICIEYQGKLQIVSLSLQIVVFSEPPVSPFLHI